MSDAMRALIINIEREEKQREKDAMLAAYVAERAEKAAQAAKEKEEAERLLFSVLEKN